MSKEEKPDIGVSRYKIPLKLHKEIDVEGNRHRGVISAEMTRDNRFDLLITVYVALVIPSVIMDYHLFVFVELLAIIVAYHTAANSANGENTE